MRVGVKFLRHRRTRGLRQHRHKLRRSTNVRNRGPNTPRGSSNLEVSSKDATTDGKRREDSVTASRSSVAVQPDQAKGVAQREHLGKGRRRIIPSPLLFGYVKERFNNFGIRNSLVLTHCPTVIEGLADGAVSHQILRNSWSSASSIQP